MMKDRIRIALACFSLVAESLPYTAGGIAEAAIRDSMSHGGDAANTIVLTATVDTVYLAPVPDSARAGTTYHLDSISNCSGSCLLMVGPNPNFVVSLSDMVVVRDNLGVIDANLLCLRIHSPTKTFAGQPDFGQKYTVIIHYKINGKIIDMYYVEARPAK